METAFSKHCRAVTMSPFANASFPFSIFIFGFFGYVHFDDLWRHYERASATGWSKGFAVWLLVGRLTAR